jgi:hypothetical protein
MAGSLLDQFPAMSKNQGFRGILRRSGHAVNEMAEDDL